MLVVIIMLIVFYSDYADNVNLIKSGIWSDNDILLLDISNN